MLLTWLQKQWHAFRAWQAENEKAHIQAPIGPCCSDPPPAADGQSRPQHERESLMTMPAKSPRQTN